jgi:hypothetical protein
MDEKIARVGSWGIGGSTGFFVFEHVAEHAGAELLAKDIPFLDLGLLGYHLYEIHEAWEEGHQKLDKLYAPCKR